MVCTVQEGVVRVDKLGVASEALAGMLGGLEAQAVAAGLTKDQVRGIFSYTVFYHVHTCMSLKSEE